jgi:Protein of unknown function (DUF2919)
MSQYKYDFSRYNRFAVVKVNALTAAAVLFLSRHILTFIVLGIALSRTRLHIQDAFAGILEPRYMYSDVPALLVLLAMLGRHPKSGSVIRLLWRSGRYLLLISAATYLVLLARQLGPDPMRYGWMVWLMILGSTAAVGYIFLSPYARDVFREFPDPEPSEDDRRRG